MENSKKCSITKSMSFFESDSAISWKKNDVHLLNSEGKHEISKSDFHESCWELSLTEKLSIVSQTEFAC